MSLPQASRYFFARICPEPLNRIAYLEHESQVIVLLAVRSECSRAEEELSRFGGPAQHDPSVSVTVGDDFLTRVQAGLHQETQREVQFAAWSDRELDWFSQHDVRPLLSLTLVDVGEVSTPECIRCHRDLPAANGSERTVCFGLTAHRVACQYPMRRMPSKGSFSRWDA